MTGSTKIILEWITGYIQNLLTLDSRPNTCPYLFSSQPLTFVLILMLQQFLLVYVLSAELGYLVPFNISVNVICIFT